MRHRPLRWMALVLACVLSGCACDTGEDPPPGTNAGEPSTDAGQRPPVACVGNDLERCAGECVKTAADTRHCGGCDNACVEGALCSFGVCACPTGRAACPDACADLASDSRHCGACDNACAPGTACEGGECVPQCPPGETRCAGGCADLQSNDAHCGRCETACTDGRSCQGGQCRCAAGEVICGSQCTDTALDTRNCGGCGTACFDGFVCSGGACVCPEGQTSCVAACVDTQNDPANCGGCNLHCDPGQQCVGGVCHTPCPPGWLECGAQCVDAQRSPFHCGACGNACGGLSCIFGQCVTCDSATTDCDGDGWTVADGDCCDQPGACGQDPAMVNPGALELPGNGIDDNCNGLVDGADVLDLDLCDGALVPDSQDPLDYARAMGICRTTTEKAPLRDRTWGLISAQLLRVDGSPLTSRVGHSIRSNFGALLHPQEGRAFAVLSSGAAADATQTQPGPNGGPLHTNIWHGASPVDIHACTQPGCLADWFNTAHPPLKLAQRLPEAPGCPGALYGHEVANDSVMLVLRMRAPTNVRAFQFNAYFLSSEYPEYVCTDFNDQFIALVDTPGGAPLGATNPVDKNLMTYSSGGQRWPVGINVAKGTGLFRVCQTAGQNPGCWDPDVSTQSCAHGPIELAGTGFDAPMGPASCTNGGGTGWLVTSGNIRPGEIVELRLALWDVGDELLDSTALLDAFRWLLTPARPGTTD